MRNKHPNLFWIITDHLRYQALSGNGNPNVDTPNIDRLAQEGVACGYSNTNYIPVSAMPLSSREKCYLILF